MGRLSRGICLRAYLYGCLLKLLGATLYFTLLLFYFFSQFIIMGIINWLFLLISKNIISTTHTQLKKERKEKVHKVEESSVLMWGRMRYTKEEIWGRKQIPMFSISGILATKHSEHLCIYLLIHMDESFTMVHT